MALTVIPSFASKGAYECVRPIRPALIATDMVAEIPRARPDLISVGRFGTPEEVADVAVLLATNGYMTVQKINVTRQAEERRVLRSKQLTVAERQGSEAPRAARHLSTRGCPG
jgi:hypothetical protein